MSSTSSRRDSGGVRASVFDICLQLGALDDNSLVAAYMFSDPSSDIEEYTSRRRYGTRFQEVISSGSDDVAGDAQKEKPHRHLLPFSIRPSALTARFKGKAKAKPPVNAPLANTPQGEGSDIDPGHVSLSRRSFFQRSLNKPSERRPDRTVHEEGVYVSTNPKTFFRRKRHLDATHSVVQEIPPTSPDAAIDSTSAPVASTSQVEKSDSDAQHLPPKDILPEDDSDEEWEEIEAYPQSPLFPLNNKGINPPPVFPSQKKTSSAASQSIGAEPDIDAEIKVQGAVHHTLTFAFPRIVFKRPSPATKLTPPSPTPSNRSRNRKALSVRTTSKHRRGFSKSLPSSPFVLLTSDHNSSMPQPTSRIVFPDDAAITYTPMHPVSQKNGMGYHNQFFTDPPKRRPKSVSVPTPPANRAVMRGPPIPFPVKNDE
ncbi:hypothetical protein Hypma_011112 [Hypsizygus marmoreus]|uniref:Uncharacterized protein n=1 Tax=Hypsizygus marmoreus TaxID=39966 RepID=A0A369JJ60_HYPMA|nr:hypothetical protein Hypma_011112 [Hypsizygus marmoreus]